MATLALSGLIAVAMLAFLACGWLIGAIARFLQRLHGVPPP